MTRHRINAEEGGPSIEMEFKGWNAPRAITVIAVVFFGGGSAWEDYSSHRDVQQTISARHEEQARVDREILERLRALETQIAVLTTRFDDTKGRTAAYAAPAALTFEPKPKG